MVPNIQSVLEKVRGLWHGGLAMWHTDPQQEISRLEDELKSDKISEAERRQISRRLCELKGIRYEDTV